MSGPEEASRRRVLLDENLPRQLAREFPEHEVSTVAGQGWRGVLNGELLRKTQSAGFDVFVTADRNLEHQQAIGGLAFGVVVLFSRRLKLEFLLPLVPAIRDAVASVKSGEVRHVKPPPSAA